MAAPHLETREGLGEVRVETGSGVIVKTESGERNVQVHIRSDIAAVRDNVTGWADPIEVPLAGGDLKNAHVRYHIETQRRPGAPIETPIADLGNRQKLRKVISLELVDAVAPASTSSGTPAPSGESQPASRGPDTHRVGPDNPGFAARLVNMAAAQVEMAVQLQPAHPAAQRLSAGAKILRELGLELLGIAS